ncbi:MAG: hypothetical protein B7Y80_17890 [Hyphomicrobium sp. 32-62-53]|nr:MAG: hypothetical protein B7Z29_17795 [Hyphomicrobium sp. 12-62-95]OYX97902.1 MAG: hypothetical protein B7Y80_17890 [Hyphomicrobium sp. 32-62-53]
MRTISALLVLTGVSLLGNQALAADLGGDCCADLEERITELESTTARKGNRKVSLEISGQINQTILAWDDGGERDVYQLMNSNSGDRVRFTGSSRISKDLNAGFFLELGARLDATASADQFSPGDDGEEIRTRQSIWFVESKALGALSIGLGAPATDDLIAYNLGGTNVAASANAPLIGGAFFTRDSAADTLNSLASGSTISLRWRRFFERLDSPTDNMVRYDSPIMMGFAASASWGGDDYWDVALRYARDTRDFKIAMGIGYYEDRNETNNTLGWPRGGDNEPNGRDTKIREIKGSASIRHEPTGLFASAAFVHREFDGNDRGVQTFACFDSPDAQNIVANGIGCTNRPDFDYFWVSGGIRQKWLPIGSTSIYGEYARSEDAVTGLNVAVTSAVGGDIDYVTDSTLDLWGIGIVQQVRAAQMEVYLSYRHLDATVRGVESTGPQVEAPLDDIDLFMAGSRIRF